MTGKILVLGSTGKIGIPLVEYLIAKKADVSVLVRDVTKAKGQLNNASVTYHQGDYTNIEQFKTSLAGVERLFLLTNNQSVEANLVKVALEVNPGLKQVVKLSAIQASASAESGSLIKGHGLAEDALLAIKNLPSLVILRPHDFAQNFLGQAASIKQGAWYANDGDAAIATIDARDIASSAATILTDPIEKHSGRTYTLTGPEALTKTEQVALLSEVLGKTVKYVDVSDAQYYNTLLSYNLPPQFAFALTLLGPLYRFHLTGHRFITGNVELITGVKARSLKAFFQENKAAFL